MGSAARDGLAHRPDLLRRQTNRNGHHDRVLCSG
jgi:hypothetical protein